VSGGDLVGTLCQLCWPGRARASGRPGKITAVAAGSQSCKRPSALDLRLSGQCLKASLTLSAACLTSPAAFWARPLVLSLRFPVTRPVVFLASPFAVWALCLIFLRMLTVPSLHGGIVPATSRQAMDVRRRVSVFAGT
jgi:hypothetical protein